MKLFLYIVLGLAMAGVAVWTAGGMTRAEEADMSKTADNVKKATFAGGCFWCVESDFEKVDGVIEVISGYTGGKEENPTYSEVSAGATGHLEAVQIIYDPAKISYEQLLDIFWRHIDPTDPDGSFVDRGEQYRPAIFYHDDEQKRLAEKSMADLEKNGPFDKPIATEILPLGAFYVAEDYHQDYYKKNSFRYKFYRFNSGRDQFLESVWTGFQIKETGARTGGDQAMENKYSKPDEKALRERLTKLQWEVTQEEGTEPPFRNEYADNKKPGIYVDVVSGEPLFSSADKYDSGTGWPSFTKPLVPEHIVTREDRKLFSTRIEVRSKYGDSHLGHVFDDGPPPTGLRYCMNSASLRFIPKEELEKEGYGEFIKLFN